MSAETQVFFLSLISARFPYRLGEDDGGYFNFKQFTIPHLKKISHDIETNLMSDITLFFFNISISLLLWKDTINTE
jgi:hypothetical protein